MKDNGVTSMAYRILEGAGWATDQYIVNFVSYSDKLKYDLMMQLAKLGKLYDEEKIDVDNDREPKVGRMNVEQVEKEYSHLNK